MNDPLLIDRHRDDRGPLFAAAGVAVLLHAAAIFIPLPDMPVPDVPPPPPEPTGIVWVTPAPPKLPDPPPVYDPESFAPKKPVPWEVPEDSGPVDEPDFPNETVVEVAEGLAEVPLGEIVPPAPIGALVVDELTDGLVPPVCIHKPTPEFPQRGTWIRQSGLVILQAVIDREGNVTEIELIDVTHPDLGYSESAIEAVGRWRYRPGRLHGRPVAVRLTVRVEFNVN